MATRSESVPAYPHVNMVAQPVDSILAAAASGDTMSSQIGSPGKEAQTDLPSDVEVSFNVSEDSPTKESRELSDSRHKWRTPRSSPSPTRATSKSRRPPLILSRSLPIKRSSSTPVSKIPMMPRRGRAAISNAELWGSEGRMVHQKVEHPENVEKSDGTVMVQIAEQFAADRAAFAQVYNAVQALSKAVNSHDAELKDHDRRLDEHTKLRFDDNKLHHAAMLHVRTGVEEMEKQVMTNGKGMFEELATKLDEAVP
jgi:hypothetical protein